MVWGTSYGMTCHPARNTSWGECSTVMRLQKVRVASYPGISMASSKMTVASGSDKTRNEGNGNEETKMRKWKWKMENGNEEMEMGNGNEEIEM